MYYCGDLLIDLADEKNINPANISDFTTMLIGEDYKIWTIILLFVL